jgi:energy-converting hydrogenase Eha subunit A
VFLTSCFAVLRALVLGLPVVTTRRRRVVRGSWRVKRKASTVLISPW